MELFEDVWHSDPESLERMRRDLGRGTYNLLPGTGAQEFVARWRLYVPADLPYGEWVRG